jgi:cytochrome c
MSDELHWNKIFGAGLATVLVILGAGEIASHVFKGEPPEHPGFKVAVAETGGETAGPALLPDWGVVLPTADVAAGQATFGKCQACHNNQSGGPNGTGPNLFGVVGRATASHPGFTYSDGMTAHAKDSPNWTYDQLFQFLYGPQAWVSGTKMTFGGIHDPQERINLIAYLRSQGSTGFAIPKPDPTREAKAAAPAASSAPAAASGAPAASSAAPAATGEKAAKGGADAAAAKK